MLPDRAPRYGMSSSFGPERDHPYERADASPERRCFFETVQERRDSPRALAACNRDTEPKVLGDDTPFCRARECQTWLPGVGIAAHRSTPGEVPFSDLFARQVRFRCADNGPPVA